MANIALDRRDNIDYFFLFLHQTFYLECSVSDHNMSFVEITETIKFLVKMTCLELWLRHYRHTNCNVDKSALGHVCPAKIKISLRILIRIFTGHSLDSQTLQKKTRLSNILKSLQPKKEKFQIKSWYFSYFCSKHRLWVVVRTASVRQF